MTNLPGTPDFQAGVASPQILLAQAAANQASVSVPLPPNIETIIIASADAQSISVSSVVGNTTATNYPVTPYGPYAQGSASPMWVCSVLDPMDSAVTVTCNPAPTQAWDVIGDMFVRQIADMSIFPATSVVLGTTPSNVLMQGVTDGNKARTLRANQQGIIYNIPSAPDTATGDHPPNDTLSSYAFVSSNTVILGAPGSGKRYRVFSLSLATGVASGADLLAFWYDPGTGLVLLFIDCNPNGTTGWDNISQTFPPSGYVMGNNSALSITYSGGSGQGVFGTVTYTLETI